MWLKSVFFSVVLFSSTVLLYSYYFTFNNIQPHILKTPLSKPRPSDDTPHANRSLKILYWTRFNEHPEWFGEGALDDCPWKCHTSKEKRDLHVADAVLVHMRDIYDVANLPKTPRSPDQPWIFYMRESPEYTFMPYTGYRPFNKLFNISMTYKRESEIHVPFFIFVKLSEKWSGVTVIKNYAAGKTKLAAWFVSNCRTPGQRERYVRLLNKYMNIDIYGRCTNIKCSSNTSTCDDLLRDNYKFYLAFENSLCAEYMTEKVERAYTNNAVPVVLGGARYSQYLPPNSYIDARNFSSPEKLADYLRLLNQNDDLYNGYFTWKQHFRTKRIHGSCVMCEYLHKHMGERKILQRADLLWNKHKDCKRPHDFYRSIANVSDMKDEDRAWRKHFSGL